MLWHRRPRLQAAHHHTVELAGSLAATRYSRINFMPSKFLQGSVNIDVVRYLIWELVKDGATLNIYTVNVCKLQTI